MNLKKIFLRLTLGISEWKTKNITDMSAVFAECISLISLPDGITQWDTSNVINISSIFDECHSLISLPDLSK